MGGGGTWGKGRASRPLDKGEAGSPKNVFSALRLSVWFKNERAGRGGGGGVGEAVPLPSIHHCIRSSIACVYFYISLRAG